MLLAAGQSRRLGRPKALVEIAEKALILRSWEELCSAGCALVVVVVNNTLNDDIVKLLPHATLVINPRPEEGRNGKSSVRIEGDRIHDGQATPACGHGPR